MPADVVEVTNKFMRDPIWILGKKEELTLERLRQFHVDVAREGELGRLPDLQETFVMTQVVPVLGSSCTSSVHTGDFEVSLFLLTWIGSREMLPEQIPSRVRLFQTLLTCGLLESTRGRSAQS